MRMLPGEFESSSFLEAAKSRPPAWDRLPVRFLIAVLVSLALAIGAITYLKTTTARSSVTAAKAESTVSQNQQVINKDLAYLSPDLRQDAASHVELAFRSADRTRRDLRDAEDALAQAFLRADADRAADKVASARRNLEKAVAEIRTVQALINPK